jgi:hypothetical protein
MHLASYFLLFDFTPKKTKLPIPITVNTVVTIVKKLEAVVNTAGSRTFEKKTTTIAKA